MILMAEYYTMRTDNTIRLALHINLQEENSKQWDCCVEAQKELCIIAESLITRI